VPLEGERARRIITATLANISNWEQRLVEIEQNCPVGCKHEALALLRDMTHAKHSLRRLAGIDPQ
jgi:hypothetical protein